VITVNVKQCQFCSLIRDHSYNQLVAEDQRTVAFFPLRPAVIGHTLVVPKEHVTDIWQADDELNSSLLHTARIVGRAIYRALRPGGMNLITSAGEVASQSVFHLHLHVVPRWPDDPVGTIWPPSGPYDEELLADAALRIREFVC
jgi:histidine triad (HIT) family protein